jgi:tetratricopeptide (TPR) repeat protein
MPENPSETQADQAFFCADYEKAAAMYEKVLEGTPNPRDHKQLALCYQRLGNSTKAERHLEEAMNGYQTAYSKDPQNTSVEQELKSCQTILESLRASHE